VGSVLGKLAIKFTSAFI